LTIAENTPFGRRREEYNLPDEELDRSLYRLCNDMLEGSGYHRYEISNFAKDGSEIRHNHKYGTVRNIWGWAAAPIPISEANGFPFRRIPTPYIEGVKTGTLQAVDMMDIPYEESVVNIHAASAHYKRGSYDQTFCPFRSLSAKAYRPLIDTFIRSGHMQEENGRFFLTLAGIDISNYILSSLLAHPIQF
jgi:oxygen-independent coproporphyrinogen-3 oxidase